MRVRRNDESGQLLLLICIYTLLAAMVLAVVIDASTVFLRRRALAAAADGAALAAAQAIDARSFYRHGPGAELPLDRVGAAEAVRAYVRANHLGDRFTSFRVTAVALTDNGHTVEVRLRCVARLPFTGVFTGGKRAVAIGATAGAAAPTS
jgi:hypothetical protein